MDFASVGGNVPEKLVCGAPVMSRPKIPDLPEVLVPGMALYRRLPKALVPLLDCKIETEST